LNINLNQTFAMKNSTITVIHLTTITLFLLSCLQLHAAEPPDQKEFSSVEERRLENVIVQERAKIRKEQTEMTLKKKELKTLEEGVDNKLAEIDNKLEQLKKLQKKIESLLEEKSAVEKKRLQDLAKIYEKMNPVKASLAIAGLDKQLAADLLANMKVKSAAKILDQSSKQKTTQLSTTFSTLQLE
jgi:flagellar motility protein MotE (MotC chaperone)